MIHFIKTDFNDVQAILVGNEISFVIKVPDKALIRAALCMNLGQYVIATGRLKDEYHWAASRQINWTKDFVGIDPISIRPPVGMLIMWYPVDENFMMFEEKEIFNKTFRYCAYWDQEYGAFIYTG